MPGQLLQKELVSLLVSDCAAHNAPSREDIKIQDGGLQSIKEGYKV